MQAIILEAFGSVDNLKVKELDLPKIVDNEVLVQVMAISINPVDVTTRAGNWLSPQLQDMNPIILGWDISGIVRKSRSSLFKEGDEVFGMIKFPGQGKAYAEYVAAPAVHLSHKPANISHAEAAAATLAALTAWQSLFRHYHIGAGQRVLIHAASGGVGHYAVQMAKHAGAYVIGTSSAANREFVFGLGVNEHIDYKNVRFEAVLKGLDFVFETIGGAQILRSLDVIKPGGTLISIPSGISDAAAKKAKVRQIKAFSTLVRSNGQDMAAIAGLLETGAIKSHVSKIYSLGQMGMAHLDVESGRTVGKVIVKTLRPFRLLDL